MPLSFSVLTLNLRNIDDRYEERRPLLLAEFARLEPDIAGLQEVTYRDEPQDTMLANAVSGRTYRAFDARSARYPDFGNAILCSVGEPQVTDELRLSNGRCAVRVLLALPGSRSLWFATTHLHHKPQEPEVRVSQAEEICGWMTSAPRADAVVVTGDFNTPPFEPAYGVMRSAGYRSAFAEANGAEPPLTWPSGIQAPTIDTEGDPNCLDYVWLSGGARSRSARLAFHQPAPGDPTLYPSDHFGIVAEIELD